jgi:hypothetical protein
MNASKNNPWIDRLNDLVQTCQTELKRTTQIGQKMLSASQSNTQIQENYLELGQMVFEAIKEGKLTWENEKVQHLVEDIKRLQTELEDYEAQVQSLKK